MSEGATSGDRQQQARNNVASRRQSGLEPRPEDLKDAGERKEVTPRRSRAEAETAKGRS
jgi:hypothetical protein